MMREIVEGIHYIHNSSFGHHGNLSAYNCVVGDRFDVKIQCYGSSAIKSRALRRHNSKSALYVAPEHLEETQNEMGSKPGDIYSFAIISSVLITMKPAFGIEDLDRIDVIEDTVHFIQTDPSFRPSLDNEVDIHSEILSLIQNCWSEIPSDRPKIGEIKSILSKSSGSRKSKNLMDHMFSLMENNANDLEADVKMRTMELRNEQKKADILLYRIMPREAADKLKLGETVIPEVFQHATVFFSDVVSFTVLASKSTPMQVINFLNDVYSLADSVLAKHDVYKVETIGDGMHVVSGVPKRNGNNHASEIVKMAIDFQRAVKSLSLPHLPDEKIQIRVGIHSGSCVAGIVGVTNPRYIVLGDTVNTSAKMEAGGRPGRIHITKSTRDLLVTHFPGNFHIFDRGDNMIKGIGSMFTYWVALPEEASNFVP